jgi:hypothetical protein
VFNLKILTPFLVLLLIPLAWADDNTFEKTFQKAGQTIDKAATKTKEFAQEAKKEAVTVAEKTEEKSKTWGGRIKGAANEFGQGVKKAWYKITGKADSEGEPGGEGFK